MHIHRHPGRLAAAEIRCCHPARKGRPETPHRHPQQGREGPWCIDSCPLTTLQTSRNAPGRAKKKGGATNCRSAAEGPSLNALIARKTIQLFGKDANFHTLSAAQQNSVYAAIVDSAGKSNPRVSSAFTRLGRAGRGLLFLSVGLSVYNVATADDKLEAAGHELAVTGGGIAGGVAGGAVAGLACGPGAPVCVTVGAFVGGALAAFGIDYFF